MSNATFNSLVQRYSNHDGQIEFDDYIHCVARLSSTFGMIIRPPTAASRAVLTNGHTGYVPRAPGFFFLFEGPPTGCGEINCLKLIVAINETA